MPTVEDEDATTNVLASQAKLLIADDHDLVREGTRALLANEADLVVIGEARNGQEALELCRLHYPDLVLMDIRMPKMDGLQATRAIKEECPKTSVLMVTVQESPEYLLDAIRAGAAGYVLKEATKHQLLSAVRRVLQGESPLNQELAMKLLQRIASEEADRRQREAANAPSSPAATTAANKRKEGDPSEASKALTQKLTPRELDVLRLLALGKTNRQITKELMVSLSTVKTHIQHIISKLEVSDRTQAAVRAVELGLLAGLEQTEQR